MRPYPPNVRRVNEKRNVNVKILVDLEGYRIRIGRFKKHIPLKKSEKFYLSNEPYQGKDHIPFDFKEDIKKIEKGANLFIDDGKILLRVIGHSGNKLKAKVYKKQWYVANKVHVEKYRKSWRKNNRLKHIAHNKLSWAIASGKIKVPKKCEECKKKRKVDGHHKDYKKPLKVTWLCKTCHNRLHKLLCV